MLSSFGANDTTSPSSLKAQTRASINGKIRRDRLQIPDPFELINSRSFSQDYLPADSNTTSQGATPLLQKAFYPIPDIILSQVDSSSPLSPLAMGLFPEIGRAYLTLGSQLFLWSFSNNRDFISYPLKDEENIISISLVKPKLNVFIKAISHVLVVVCKSTIQLLGVSFAHSDSILLREGKYASADLILHQSNITFPTDEVIFSSAKAVTSTPEGRIFLGGQDSNIYELDYQAAEGWFTRRCRKICRTSSFLQLLRPSFLDSSVTGTGIDGIKELQIQGNLLFSLKQNGHLSLYRIDSDSSFEPIASISCSQLHYKASRMLPSPGTQLPRNPEDYIITSITPCSPIRDSAYIAIVAVTTQGHRIYFSTLRTDQLSLSRTQVLSCERKNSSLNLLHIRLPPPRGSYGGDGGGAGGSINNSNNSNYNNFWSPSPSLHSIEKEALPGFTNIHLSDGITILSGPSPDGMLCLLTNQALALNPSLVGSCSEFSQASPLPPFSTSDRVWCITSALTTTTTRSEAISSESNSNNENWCSTTFLPNVTLPSSTGVSVGGARSDVLIFTSAGIHLLRIKEPWELLEELFKRATFGPSFQKFQSSYGTEQTLFLALRLGLSSKFSLLNESSLMRGIDMIIKNNKDSFAVDSGYGGNTTATNTTGTTTTTTNTTKIGDLQLKFELNGTGNSALHAEETQSRPLWHAIHTLVARLLDPIWNRPLRSLLKSSSGSKAAAAASSSMPSLSIIKDVLKLSSHFEGNQVLLENLKRITEFISLFPLLRDYNVLKCSDMQWLTEMTLDELIFTAPQEQLLSLATHLLNRGVNGGGGGGGQELCSHLLRCCPTLFGEGQLPWLRSREILERAKKSRSPSDRTMLCGEALAILRSHELMMPLSLLLESMSAFSCLEEWGMGVELGVLSAINDPSSNHQRYDSLFGEVFELIKVSISAGRGLQVIKHYSKISCASGGGGGEQLSLRLHGHLFLFLLANGEEGLLLKNDFPGTLSFLQALKDCLLGVGGDGGRNGSFDDDENSSSDGILDHISKITNNRLSLAKDASVEARTLASLYWRYLAKRGDSSSAKALLEMAICLPQTLPSKPIYDALALKDRIEFLTLALSHCKGGAAGGVDHDVVREIEERLDVARLQRECVSMVKERFGDVAELRELGGRNYGLWTLSDLFNRFLVPMSLDSLSLVALKMSGCRDPSLIHKVWSNLIQNELESPRKWDSLRESILLLHQRLKGCNRIFPREFLIDSLMALSGKMADVSPTWIISLLCPAIVGRDRLGEVILSLIAPLNGGGGIGFWKEKNGVVWASKVLIELKPKIKGVDRIARIVHLLPYTMKDELMSIF